MQKGRAVLGAGVLGALAGAVIAEFFPRMFQSGISGALGSALNDTFSQYRNDLAVKYGFTGLVIGLAAGIAIVLVSGKKK
jgi:hypothetical protein